MEIYTVDDIIEEDFGCEGMPEGHTLKCLVKLKDNNGDEKQILVADDYLYKNCIDIGDYVRFIEEEVVKE